jgi:hypothetical protein
LVFASHRPNFGEYYLLVAERKGWARYGLGNVLSRLWQSVVTWFQKVPKFWTVGEHN